MKKIIQRKLKYELEDIFDRLVRKILSGELMFNLRLKCRKKEKGGKRRQGEIRLRLECVPVPWEALEDCKQKSENLSLL